MHLILFSELIPIRCRSVFELQLCIHSGADAATMYNIFADTRTHGIHSARQSHLHAQSDRHPDCRLQSGAHVHASHQFHDDCRQRSEAKLPRILDIRLAADHEARPLRSMRRLRKSNGNRFVRCALRYVHLFAAVCASRRQLRNFLLDAFAVRAVLDFGTVSRSEFLEMVHRTVVHLFGGTGTQVSLDNVHSHHECETIKST